MARFTPGKSGNPKGRPKTGSILLRQALSEHGAEVAGVVLSAALSGDLTACKLVLERLVSPLKSTASPVTLILPPDAGLTDTAKAILSAAAGGQLPPDVASQLITAVSTLARITELDELDRRLKLLEGGEKL